MEYTKITYKKQVIFIMLIYSYNEKQMNKYICDNIQKKYCEYEVQVCKHIGPLRLTHHGIEAKEPMLVRGRI